MLALEIKNLQKTYRDGKVALKDVNFSVKQGDFFALLGPNGAGKSTIIGMISSLVNITGGQIKIFGHDIVTDSVRAKQNLGVVPQEFNFSIFEKVEDIVKHQAGYFGIKSKQATERAHYYIKKLGLWNKRHTIAQRLSGGMKRRLMIARALVTDPKLLILDEPTAGVDIEIRRSMWTFLQEINRKGTTIILTTHYLEEAESLCKEIAIIDKGSIIKNMGMRALLQTLQQQAFVLDLTKPLDRTLNTLPGIACKQIDSQTIEVSLPLGKTLNELFDALNQQNIQIASLRNKTNRLEELFLSLTHPMNT